MKKRMSQQSLEIGDIIRVLRADSTVNRPYQMVLIDALQELDNMVGMEEVKRDVIDQLLYCISCKEQGERVIDLLHTVITGPPGVGKSNLAMILAKIWASLGIIGTQRPIKRTDLSPDQQIIVHLTHNAMFISDQLSQIRPSLPDEAAETDASGHDIVTRLNWIWEVARESEESGEPVRKLLEGTTQAAVSPKIITAGRDQLVGKYQGHTAVQTKKILEEARGGVLFIDEAYQLVNDKGKGDSFGREALNVICQQMTEGAGDIIVIFAGYREEMEETIFSAQPGLARRFAWRFDIPGYLPSELSSIFRRQVIKSNWSLECSVTDEWLTTLFRDNKELMSNFGGDTQRLAFYSKIIHSRMRFLDASTVECKTLNRQQIESALDRLKENKQKVEPPPPFYS